MDRLRNVVGNLFSPMKNMVAVESDDSAKGFVRTSELISNFKKQVVAEERWEIPSEATDDGATVQPVQQRGVVVTLDDGETRYLVRRIPNEKEEGAVDVIVTYASQMESNWVRVEEKQVQNAKLEDYVNPDGDQPRETKGNLGESDVKKESTDAHLVQSEDRGVETGNFGDKADSGESHKDSDEAASKM